MPTTYEISLLAEELGFTGDSSYSSDNFEDELFYDKSIKELKPFYRFSNTKDMLTVANISELQIWLIDTHNIICTAIPNTSIDSKGDKTTTFKPSIHNLVSFEYCDSYNDAIYKSVCEGLKYLKSRIQKQN